MLGLGEEGVPVIQARLAERLGRSAPSVSEMLDRLTEDGYVTRQGRRLHLTGGRPHAWPRKSCASTGWPSACWST